MGIWGRIYTEELVLIDQVSKIDHTDTHTQNLKILQWVSGYPLSTYPNKNGMGSTQSIPTNTDFTWVENPWS